MTMNDSEIIIEEQQRVIRGQAKIQQIRLFKIQQIRLFFLAVVFVFGVGGH
jgi:hypothetical protein